jgi:hypothetical protein
MSYLFSVFRDAIRFYHENRRNTVVDSVRKNLINAGVRKKKPSGGKHPPGTILPKRGRPRKNPVTKVVDSCSTDDYTSQESQESEETSALMDEFEDAVDEPIVSTMNLLYSTSTSSAAKTSKTSCTLASEPETTIQRLMRERNGKK